MSRSRETWERVLYRRTMPEVVTISDKTRRRVSGEANAAPAKSTPTNDDRTAAPEPKSAIVTVRRRSRFGAERNVSRVPITAGNGSLLLVRRQRTPLSCSCEPTT